MRLLRRIFGPAPVELVSSDALSSEFLMTDNAGSSTPDPFEPVVEVARLDPRFVQVSTHASHAPARTMFRTLFEEFEDPDGNFLEQFHTSGFDARTWEFFLFAYLSRAGFEIDRTHTAPDFLCNKGGKTVALEATTANPRGGTPMPSSVEALQARVDEPPDQTLDRLENELPIRFGGPLFSKLQRRYWEQEHIAGHPLIFAIESFASEDALYFGDVGLASYLYGLWSTASRTLDGKLVVTSTPIEKHRLGGKEIPSGFFSQPDTEHVSAVLWGNTGTFPKFGRMATQDGIGSVLMIRRGWCYDHDPNASEPILFAYDVAKRPSDWGIPETWGEGLAMYHNPNALIPVDEELFPEIGHFRLTNGQVTGSLPAFHPFISVTYNLGDRRGRH
jgi:hypothetical protein